MQDPEPGGRMGDSVGLEANRPLAEDGALAHQVADPRIIADTGAGWVRLNFVLGPWDHVRDQTRREGRTWEEAYRAMIEGFRREGLRVYGLISNEAVKSGAGDVTRIFRGAPPAEARSHPWIEDYVATFVEILRMFGGSLSVVESFNEPDGWHGGRENMIHPGWFAIMLERIYREVRSRPEFAGIKLVSGPVEGTAANSNGGALNYLPQVYKQGVRRFGWGQPGKPFPFDGVAYHMYVEENLNRAWPSHQDAVRRTYRKYLGALRETIRQAGDSPNKPVYVSEMGWYTNNGPEDRQAECLPVGLELLVNGPWKVALAVVFCTQDFGDQATLKWYGLYRQGFPSPDRRKPAYEAFRLFCQRATGPGVSSGPVGSAPPGLRNQDVINAFAALIRAFNLKGWGLLAQNGISLNALVADRKGLYAGPDLASLPKLTIEQQALLLSLLKEIAPQAGMQDFAAPGAPLMAVADLTTGLEMLPEELALSSAVAASPLERRVTRTWNRWGGLLTGVAAELGVELATIVGIPALSARRPAFDREGRLRIRFDVQDFLLRSQVAPETLAGRFRTDPARPWTRQHWRRDADAEWDAVHASQDSEWEAFRAALDLDADAAYAATGIGITGVMGFNHDLLGYESAKQMMLSHQSSGRMQMLGLFDLIAGPDRNSQALEALRGGDLETFAALHVGPEGAARYAAELCAARDFFRRVNPLTAA
jgi:hypothetical protein